MLEGAAAASTEAALNIAEPAPRIEINASRGFAAWLQSQNLSLAFTSYQTGQLFLVGRLASGSISFNQQNFSRAMGLYAQPDRLYLATQSQIWRLENMLRPGELGNGAFDAVFVPRNAQTTGDVDAHELGIDAKGRVVFVNTRFSCLATLDMRFSFRPVWKPPFISKLTGEDRCHLNGLAIGDGEPRYVTAVSQTDLVDGWRARRDSGGVLIDVRTDRIVADDLSMPHSPRIHGQHVYLLDSGRGQIIRVDPATGAREKIAFCPGFLRGLAIHNDYAIVTVSKPRDGSFRELALQAEIEQRGGEAWCGILVIDLKRGDIAEWVRLEGEIVELFDVAAIPGVTCPMSLGVDTIELQNTIVFDDQISP